MSTSTIPSQPKKSIAISLRLKISGEDRNRLLDDGAEPLLPLFRKHLEKPEGDNNNNNNNNRVDPEEAAIPPSLDISRHIRLLDIIRHDWDIQQEDLDSEEEKAWEYRHKQWLGQLANAITVVMMSHWDSLIQVSDSSDDDSVAGTDDAEDEAEEQWKIEALEDAQELSDRLMKEPKRSRSWIKYLGLGVQERTFTGSDFLEPCALAGVATGFVNYLQRNKVGNETQRNGLKALMKVLAKDIEECESLETWLMTSLMLFLGAAEVLRLQENPTRHAAKPVVAFLRNYVATVLLVESVIGGDEKAKPEDEGKVVVVV